MAEFSEQELAARQMASRLKSERHAHGLTVEGAAAAGGVARTAQFNYENGSRTPDAMYLRGLSAAGCDVLYIVTGRRERSAALSSEERRLVDAYSSMSDEAKAVIQGVISLPGSAKK